MGIACGGPLDLAQGRLLAPPNLPGWEHAPLVAWFSADFGKPVALVNDANAGALAEWRWGAGQGASDLVFLTCGTGLGAGIIAGGRLLAGAGGNAGEIGHVRLTEDGPLGYGKRGSVQGWASGGGIGRQACAAGWPADTSAKDVALAADAGDPRAIALLEKAGGKLGRAVALLVDLLNPQVVVLGSLFARARAATSNRRSYANSIPKHCPNFSPPAASSPPNSESRLVISKPSPPPWNPPR